MQQKPVTDTADVICGVEAIAAFLDLTPRRVKHWIAEHELPVFKIGRAICARRSTLWAWLRDRETAPPTPKKKPTRH